MADSESQVAAPPDQSGSLLATASLVLAVAGLVTCWIAFVGLVLGAVGLAGGIVARKSSSASGQALAGILISALALVLSLAFTGCQVACWSAATRAPETTSAQDDLMEQFDKEMEKAREEAMKGHPGQAAGPVGQGFPLPPGLLPGMSPDDLKRLQDQLNQMGQQADDSLSDDSQDQEPDESEAPPAERLDPDREKRREAEMEKAARALENELQSKKVVK